MYWLGMKMLILTGIKLPKARTQRILEILSTVYA